jgi:hypothetical protein
MYHLHLLIHDPSPRLRSPVMHEETPPFPSRHHLHSPLSVPEQVDPFTMSFYEIIVRYTVM